MEELGPAFLSKKPAKLRLPSPVGWPRLIFGIVLKVIRTGAGMAQVQFRGFGRVLKLFYVTTVMGSHVPKFFQKSFSRRSEESSSQDGMQNVTRESKLTANV